MSIVEEDTLLLFNYDKRIYGVEVCYLLSWIDGLSILEAGALVFIIGAVNVLYIIGIKNRIEKYYKKTQSRELTLNRMRLLTQYVYLIFIAVSSFFTVLLFMFLLEAPFGDSKLHSIVSLVCTFIFLGMVLTINQLILSKTTQKIRGTEETVKDELKSTIAGLLLIFAPITFFIGILSIIPDGLLGDIGYVLILLAFLISVPFFSALLLRRMLKAYDMPSSELKDDLLQFLKQIYMEDVKLYLWPTKKKKVANAVVTGVSKRKQVLLSDYLLENMSRKEIEAILAHEVGHLKHNHIWKRVILLAFFPILTYGLGKGLDMFETSYGELPYWLGIGIILIFVVGYLGIVFLFVSRIQEREADKYVLSVGIDYRDYASGLMKLAKLNDMVTNMNKLDESFQTHPSIAKRVRWIIEEANGSTEEFLEYQVRENTD
ncbi:M48 family metallopeptidase [Evansella cellulosilytica]|uniref:Peptidase M48 Ste24p n=1 Tax=Evansella cellulosilytica (strain ATCC 21833 / DSM 2522 / FERM P-1141 / JCM 9156 / N-4) TaxID=649639 RepID=E6TXJ6_EVAC2|nr:M48 family metallopeptidase [Evansella cellulosilytica]ADU28810.1 peptidase M48 Ste24p [Evansella cellulosilytica DSM 2522]